MRGVTGFLRSAHARSLAGWAEVARPGVTGRGWPGEGGSPRPLPAAAVPGSFSRGRASRAASVTRPAAAAHAPLRVLSSQTPAARLQPAPPLPGAVLTASAP